MDAQKKFMRTAIREAKKGIEKSQSPFGACIVKEGKKIASAHNGVWGKADPTAHAEIVAIRKACKKLKTIDLTGCEIYSTCEPCPMCFSAIHWAKIGRIVYGTGIADAKVCGFSELEITNEDMKRLGKSSLEVQAGFMAEECRQLFALFSEKGGKERLY
jgi:guanine deaminase